MMKYNVTVVFALMLSIGLFAQQNQQRQQNQPHQQRHHSNQQKKQVATKQQQTSAPDNLAKSYFSIDKKTVDFEKIKMGTTKTIEVAFTNTGKKTLVLIDVYTNCGCTVVDWPRDPFLPGKSGVLKLTYNPTEEGPFNKTVTVYTNAENNKEVIQIEGIVTPK